MINGQFVFAWSISFDEDQHCFLMIHSWLMKVVLWFSHKRHRRARPTTLSVESEFSSALVPLSLPHMFSPPLRLSMLRKVRCRVQRSTSARSNNVRWNASQNCAETSSTNHCRRDASLIVIDINERVRPSHKRQGSTVAISSSQNISSASNESPTSSATTLDTPSSDSDSSPSINRKNEKTWRLQIQDDLNKDGSRHFVMHKGRWRSM